MSVIKDIQDLKAKGYDPSSIEDAIRWNEQWEAFFTSPIGSFLAYGGPQELWRQADVPLLDANTIARNVVDLIPDAILFKFGILPIWTSVGGNVICGAFLNQ
jgi:hypothetical protein